MGRVLAVNVAVDEKMYGPDYPGPVPDDVAARIGDHCWADASDAPEQAAGVEGSPEPSDEPAKTLEDHTKAELVELADAHSIDSSGTKAEVLERLQAAGVEG